MQAVYQLRIVLNDVEPEIWREVLVPAELRLDQLHQLIQVTMGWQNSHLHEFMVEHPVTKDEHTFTDAESVAESGSGKDERDITIGELFIAVKDKMTYVYDFGNDWIHDVKVQKILSAAPGENYPQCVGGRRACPPEDCGGPWQYGEFWAALADPEHEKHAMFTEWIGGGFDAEKFALAEVQRVIADSW